MAVQEEEAEVEVLYANLGKLNALTKRIQGSMSRLDDSGKVVKEAIGPIYSNTQSLQVTSKNVERINDAIERMRQPLDAKGREEGIIRAGVRNTGLPQYLGALKRVDRALTELNTTNLRSNQQAISEFTNLLAAGSKQLEDSFKSLLKEDIRPIEPLTFITKQLAFPTLPEEKLPQLSQIASAMSMAASQESRYGSQGDNPAAVVYSEIRGPYLTASLQNLATASINTSKRSNTDGSLYKQGTSGIGAYASGIEGMFLAESENISRVFPAEQAAAVLELTVRSTMAEFSRTIRELDSFVKSNVMSDIFLAFEIMDIVTPLSYRLDQKTGGLRSIFAESLRPVRETTKSALVQILEETRRRSGSVAVLPNDGATIPFVSETMTRLSSLASFSTPLSSILSSIGDGNWRNSSRATAASPSLDVNPDSFTLTANYLMDVLAELLTNLEARARSFHRTKPLQGCFLANIVSVVDRSIRSSPDLARYLNIPPHSTRLEPFRKKGSSLYLDAWREPSGALLDVQYTNRSNMAGSRTSGSGQPTDSAAIIKGLSSKDKDKIKDKFKAFNSSFDELVARHKSLNMERDVRSSLGREIQAMIEPLYVRFWDRYHEIDKKGKTVKYSKADMARELAGLG